MSDIDMRSGILSHCRAHQVAHALTWNPAHEASLRAAYGRTEIARRRTFEEAMAVPALAAAIRAMALSLRQTPGELFDHQENHS